LTAVTAATRPSGELVVLVHGDVVGLTRGKAVPAAAVSESLEVGWTPANLALDPFGVIAPEQPFGALGDVKLRPAPGGEVRVEMPDGGAPLRLHICDALDADGSPWEACPRGALLAALDALRERSGLRVVASFEHEFRLDPPAGPGTGAFSLSRIRAAAPFPERLVAALDAAGCEPESLIAEYGPDQFEVPVAPAEGVRAADRALILREVVREVARGCGRRASFAPLMAPGDVGNGVHVHLSLRDESGEPATYDPAGPGELSAAAAAFGAGILDHVGALCAVTAPSPPSYLRLGPGHWSAGYAYCARSDREATIRLPTALTRDHDRRSRTANLEFRAADATASPHLVLAGLVRAGLDGIERGAQLSVASAEDSVAAGARTPLPASLGEALEAFEADPVTTTWTSPTLRGCYLAVKRHQIRDAVGEDAAEMCARYSGAY
jgi:glutamine synthetase